MIVGICLDVQDIKQLNSCTVYCTAYVHGIVACGGSVREDCTDLVSPCHGQQ